LGGKIESGAIDDLQIKSNIKDVLNLSLDAEKKAISAYKTAIKLAHNEDDFTTIEIFGKILCEKEKHKRCLEVQLELMEKMGMQDYMLFISQNCCDSKDHGHNHEDHHHHEAHHHHKSDWK